MSIVLISISVQTFYYPYFLYILRHCFHFRERVYHPLKARRQNFVNNFNKYTPFQLGIYRTIICISCMCYFTFNFNLFGLRILVKLLKNVFSYSAIKYLIIIVEFVVYFGRQLKWSVTIYNVYTLVKHKFRFVFI
jgi:hypothetical protein